MKKIIFVGATLSLTLSVHAGIYRHDKKVKKYAALAAQPQFDCVGQLWKGSEWHGSCVLVGGRYVLSAAHCFIEASYRPDTIKHGNQTIVVNQPYNQHLASSSAYQVLFNGRKYQCKELKVYHEFMDTVTRGSLDVALLELTEEVAGVAPAVMNAKFDELNGQITGVGYGVSGPANKPDKVKSGRKKLAGENVVDSIGGYKLNDNFTTMFCDFDYPAHEECNKMGSATPRPLEYICGGGDSGGGLFRQTAKGAWELIGICHGNGVDVDQLMKTGYYGQIMSWTRVSVFRSWIEENMK